MSVESATATYLWINNNIGTLTVHIDFVSNQWRTFPNDKFVWLWFTVYKTIEEMRTAIDREEVEGV